MTEESPNLNAMPLIQNGKFMMALCGRSGSGKTHLLYKMLKYGILKKFQRVYLWCPSYIRGQMQEPHIYDYVNWDMSWEVYEDEHVIKVFNYMPMDGKNTLFVLDDCISEKGFKKNAATGALNMLAHRGRQKRVSTIVLTQCWTGIPTQLRGEIDYAVIFSRLGWREMNQIKIELCTLSEGGWKDFVNIANKYLITKHDWIFYKKNEGEWIEGKTDNSIKELE